VASELFTREVAEAYAQACFSRGCRQEPSLKAEQKKEVNDYTKIQNNLEKGF